jgi:hypothetical protein
MASTTENTQFPFLDDDPKTLSILVFFLLFPYFCLYHRLSVSVQAWPHLTCGVVFGERRKRDQHGEHGVACVI